VVLVLLANLNSVVCVEKNDICYLRDEAIDYNLPLSFSLSEKPMVEMLAREINYLIKEHVSIGEFEEDCDYLD